MGTWRCPLASVSTTSSGPSARRLSCITGCAIAKSLHEGRKARLQPEDDDRKPCMSAGSGSSDQAAWKDLIPQVTPERGAVRIKRRGGPVAPATTSDAANPPL